MANVPEQHLAVAHEWLDGAEVQCRAKGGAWIDDPDPGWHADLEYRLKPRKVKKWRWVIRCSVGLRITDNSYTEEQAREHFDVIERIDSTMIEVAE